MLLVGASMYALYVIIEVRKRQKIKSTDSCMQTQPVVHCLHEQRFSLAITCYTLSTPLQFGYVTVA